MDETAVDEIGTAVDKTGVDEPGRYLEGEPCLRWNEPETVK